MKIPASVVASQWVPLVIVTVGTLLVSIFYILYLQHTRNRGVCIPLVAILSIFSTLLTCVVFPVDVFLVSELKNPNGTFKDWVEWDNGTSSVMHVLDALTTTYLVLYGVTMLFAFFILPFAYFLYEQHEDGRSMSKNVCSALKCTLLTAVIAGVLLMLGGVLANLRTPPTGDAWDQAQNVFEQIATTDIENILAFSMSIMAVLGMLLLLIYAVRRLPPGRSRDVPLLQPFGMTVWPIFYLVRGTISTREELGHVSQERTRILQQLEASRSSHGSAAAIDLEESVTMLEERQRALIARTNTVAYKLRHCWRPLEVVCGILLFIMGFLIFISLLLANIDKLMHSLGPKFGYVLPQRYLPNPIDMSLVLAQHVFPLDYVLFCLIVLYLLLSSMAGIQKVGLWFFCVKVSHVEKKKTRPQGVLFLCSTLVLIILSLTIMVYFIAPQYSSFGSQHYVANVTDVDPITHVVHFHGETKTCSTAASMDDCVSTRITLLLNRVFYKFWIIGTIFYWLSWGFLLFYFVMMLASFGCKKRSSVRPRRESYSSSSDDELIGQED